MPTRDWGGIAIDFSGCRETLEMVFGNDNISPGILSRRLWTYINAKGLKRQTRLKARLAGVDRTPRLSVTPSDPIDDVTTYQRRKRA